MPSLHIVAMGLVFCPEPVPPHVLTTYVLAALTSKFSICHTVAASFSTNSLKPIFGCSIIIIMSETRLFYVLTMLLSLGSLVFGELVSQNDLFRVLARYESVSTYYNLLKVGVDGPSRRLTSRCLTCSLA